MRSQAAELIQTFQFSIMELSAKLEAEKDSMSPEDIESTNYVVGMAALNSFNLARVVNKGAGYYQANKEKVDRLITKASGFAEALRAGVSGILCKRDFD